MFHPNVRDGDQHVRTNLSNLSNSWDQGRTIEDILLGISDIKINPVTKGAYGNEPFKLLKKNAKYFKFIPNTKTKKIFF